MQRGCGRGPVAAVMIASCLENYLFTSAHSNVLYGDHFRFACFVVCIPIKYFSQTKRQGSGLTKLT